MNQRVLKPSVVQWQHRLAISLLWLLLPVTLAASTDGERFKQIYEKEWVFRLLEFPMLASSIGVDKYAGELGRVSEQDQQRRHQYWQKFTVIRLTMNFARKPLAK